MRVGDDGIDHRAEDSLTSSNEQEDRRYPDESYREDGVERA